MRDYFQVLELVPFCFDTTWIDPYRVSIVGSLLKKKATLRVFFEEDRNRRILRIRVSTDSHYASATSRDDLIHLIKDRKRKEFPFLFPRLVKFITDETKKGDDSEQQACRFAMFSEGFKAAVNSEKIAPLAVRCGDREQLDYLHQFYAPENSYHEFEACWDKENSTRCCCCHLTDKTGLFLSHDGMTCRECMASFITSQLRLNQFPLEIPVVTAPGTSPLELLYAILPLPVVSLLLKKSFAFFKCSDYPYMVFVRCPQCMAPLAITEKCDFHSCTCPACGCAWCYLCNWEPHWPMSCEQFKHLFDKDYFYSEKEIRMCCDCELVYQIHMDSSFPFRCPNHRCRWNYTDDGQYGHWHYCDTPISPRMWQHIRALDAGMKYCDECGIRTRGVLEPKRLIRKDVANICVEARNQRFKAPNREDFERNVAKLFALKAEQNKVNDLRNTVFFLVENCTAWLYLDGSNKYKHLKKAVAQLFQQMLIRQHQTWTPRDQVIVRLEELEEATNELISLFHQHTLAL
ncbi:hypothetical protein Y032_0033g2672 [Ancylostoma ceylanicum]|uniref:IBR domain-containing protein n=1 Tax=Ancylostoma ceylanicum TaxID=53326 RepID=A0A016UM41_9BILA|nr:hypothetical protein Y032_0033g2672 [Ancylostoma ceylanicum]